MSRFLKEIEFDDFNKLSLHIYTVGYPTQGESILTVLAEDDRALLVMVTDSFAQSKFVTIDGKRKKRLVNRIETLLSEEWNGAPINFFIWSHPHRDHSVGIKELLEDCDQEQQAKILMPNLTKGPKYSEVAVTTLDYIWEQYADAVVPCDFSSYNFPVPAKKIRLKRRLSSEFYDIDLYFLSPERNVQWTQSMLDHPEEPNNFSLAYLLEVNGIRVFMGGDLSTKNLNEMPMEFLSGLHFVKIPHHGSDRLPHFCGKLFANNSRNFIATTTQYRIGSSDLPVEKVLTEYKSSLGAQVYTSCQIPYIKSQDKHIGIIHTILHLSTGRSETVAFAPAMQF